MSRLPLLSDGTKPPRLPPWFQLVLKILAIGLLIILVWAMRPVVYVAGFFLESWRLSHR